MLIHDKNTSSSKVVQLKTSDNFKNGSKNIYDFPFGIKSAMPARVVSPNHIQFSERTEPPNFLKNQTSMNENKDTPHENEGKRMEEDMVDMVAETPT